MQVQLIKDGVVVAVDEMSVKVFSSGSRGFRANFKAGIDGARYQANFNLVEIGSKPKTKTKSGK